MTSRRILSFKYALDGIVAAFKEEPNLKIHFLVSIFVLLAAWFFQINFFEWIAVIISIGLVISLELTNTAIEAVVDSFTEKDHPGAKLAKDISAGAVLIVSLMALSVGVFIFLPYVLNFFNLQSSVVP